MRVAPDPTSRFNMAVLSSEVQELGMQNGNLNEMDFAAASNNEPDAVLRVEQTQQTCTSVRAAARACGRAHTVHMEPLLQALW